jgi:membrane-associated phospholipid phosphatase
MPYRIARPLLPVLLALLLLPTLPGSAAAQRALRTIGSDVANGVGDMLYVFSSPVRARGRDWARVGVAGGIIAVTGLADREMSRWIAENQSSVAVDGLKPFREGQDVPLVNLGSPKHLLPLTGSAYAVGFILDSRALRDAAIGCASAHQAVAAVQSLTLQVVQRERPLTADGDALDVTWGSGPWERHSFFSGHASNVMSCVSYWNARFEMGPVEPALYALALGVGLGRMADQRHWASDIATGTILGYAIGATAGRRARQRAERESGTPVTTTLLDGAYVTSGGGGVRIGWQRSF